MNIVQILTSLIIIGILIYVGIVFFQALLTSLWAISPLSTIGFVVSVGVAIWKRRISFEKEVKNFQIVLFIFAGTIVSYVATSQLQNLWNNVIAGNIVGAAVIGIVILVRYFKGREIKNRDP